jgi:hypothetical protein
MYHGLTVGTSSRAEVLAKLGNPASVGREQDTGLATMSYKVSDPISGTLVVYVKKGILDGMTLYPLRAQTKADIIRVFGSEFIVARYAADECSVQGGTATIYESPSGNIKHLEYRERGVAAVFSHDDDEKIEAIVFTSRAFGPTHSSCKGSDKGR